MFNILIAWVYTYDKTYQIIYVKYVWIIVSTVYLIKAIKKKKKKRKHAQDHAVTGRARIQTFKTCTPHPTPCGLSQFWGQQELRAAFLSQAPPAQGSVALSTSPELLDHLPFLPPLPKQQQTPTSQASVFLHFQGDPAHTIRTGPPPIALGQPLFPLLSTHNKSRNGDSPKLLEKPGHLGQGGKGVG